MGELIDSLFESIPLNIKKKACNSIFWYHESI